MMGCVLQAELMAVRILAKVENICMCLFLQCRHFLTASPPAANLINLACLPYMPNAGWDPRCTCISGTNVPVIDDILRWFPRTAIASERIYVLLDRSRCGKSSTSHTIAQVLRREGRLGSSIFLSREVEGRNNPSTIFSTIARDLAAFDNKIKEGICRAIESDPGLPFACIERQFQDLIIGPTQNLTIVGPIMIIIDGLDECKDIKDRARLLRVLTQESACLPTNFRILLTARPEADIEAAFLDVEHHIWRGVKCDDNGDILDVPTYIKEALMELSRAKPALFLSHAFDTVLKELTERVMEIPFCAITACKFLAITSDKGATKFVDVILSQSRPSGTEESIDKLYDAILRILSFESNFDLGWQAFLRAMVKTPSSRSNSNGPTSSVPPTSSASQTSTLIFSRESLSSLSTPSAYHPIETLLRVECLLETNDSHTIRLHPAFEAFLMNKQRCTDQRFFIDITVDYEPVAEVCLHIMNNLLSRNICRIENASLLNSELSGRRERVAQFVPESLRYASKNWLSHVLAMKQDASHVIKQLRRFFFVHLLHWIELSSLTGEFDTVLTSLKHLPEWLEVCFTYIQTSAQVNMPLPSNMFRPRIHFSKWPLLGFNLFSRSPMSFPRLLYTHTSQLCHLHNQERCFTRPILRRSLQNDPGPF
jgi:hypothetical protein